MSLILGYHSGTIARDPFELCRQTMPQSHSFVVYVCSLHSVTLYLFLPSHPLAVLCSRTPDPNSQSPPSQPFPVCLPNFSWNTLCISHLNWEWDLPRRHCCLCSLPRSRLFILLRYKNSGQHSPRSSWPLPSHYASPRILKHISFVSHTIWLYH